MNPALKRIPGRILDLARGALAQANTHALFSDPGNEHWEYMSVLNAAHAGELFMKAAIAKEHPLLIFRDIFALDDRRDDPLDIDDLIRRGRTHDFEKLPQVLWATTGKRIANPECFERLRHARNAIQHFCVPEEQDFSALSLTFIYTIIDPLIADAFGLCAIEYHEDHSVGYDYVVEQLLRHGLKFTIPANFKVTEIHIEECIDGATEDYRTWVKTALIAPAGT